jgi:hypothetical protein
LYEGVNERIDAGSKRVRRAMVVSINVFDATKANLLHRCDIGLRIVRQES